MCVTLILPSATVCNLIYTVSENFQVVYLSTLSVHVYIFDMKERSENNSTLWLKDNTMHEGVAPLVWRFGGFPILISNPAPCNGR